MAYENLFYIEYAFPPIAVSLFYLLNLGNATGYNTLLTFCVVLHFVKRLLETKYVHIFGNPSVPFKTLLRNCGHYWLLIGLFVPIECFYLRKPQLGFGATLLFLLFLAFEAGNLYCHWELRKLRVVEKSDGAVEITKERKIPKGLFFDHIVSPNYTFEILAWLTFTVLFKSFVGLIFTALSAWIMTLWALEKKRKLIASTNEVNEKRIVGGRAAILPMVI